MTIQDRLFDLPGTLGYLVAMYLDHLESVDTSPNVLHDIGTYSNSQKPIFGVGEGTR